MAYKYLIWLKMYSPEEISILNAILQIVPENEAATQQPQPTKLESFFALTKSLIIRALIIYFVSSFLRKPSTTTDVNSNQSGVQSSTRSSIAASNLFQNGTLFDLHVYISEEQTSVNFSDTKSLLWFQEGLIYGDWYSGRNGDGSISHHTKIQATKQLQVSVKYYMDFLSH